MVEWINMKITRKNTSKTRVELTITLNNTELTHAEEVALVQLGEKVKIPGFRPGKVPIALVKKHVSSEELNAQTLNVAINRAVPDAYNSEKLQVLDRPEVEVKKFVPNQELEFTAEVDILPAVKLKEYKKLQATKPKVTVAEKDIDEVVERMRQGFAEKKEVVRVAKMGDEVTINFKGFDAKGEAFAGGEGKDYPLTLGSGSFIPGFEEGIVGKKAQETVTLPITFPADYHAAHLAGQKCTFEVTINTVKEVILPKVDAAFAAKCGPFKTIKELRNDIKREITAQREHEANEQYKDKLVDALIAQAKPVAPESLIKTQMKNIETDFTQNLAARGLTLEQYLQDKKMTRDEWEKKELYNAAKKRIESSMVLNELGRVENITVSDEEIAARHQQLLEQYKDPNIRLQLETPEARQDIANRLATEKTLDLLVQLN